MRFFAFENDLGISGERLKKSYAVSGLTSVGRQIKQFFECIRSFGEIAVLDKRLSRKELTSIFKKPDAIFVQGSIVSDDFSWETIPKRVLKHALGDFLIPARLLDAIRQPFNSVHCVITNFEMKRVQKYLKKAAPRMVVCPHRLEEEKFYLPTKKERLIARRRLNILRKDIHIVYAGRWISTKGICQLMRVLNLWPLANAKITLIGNFIPQLFNNRALGIEATFENYFRRQFMRRFQKKQIRLIKAKDPEGLREIFWSGDLFVYPSIWEDENFGIAPREAVLCGLPVVVTNFGGLYQLADMMPWGGIDTYSTLQGPRFSLYQFRNLITQALKIEKNNLQEFSDSVKRECDIEVSRTNLRKAIEYLIKTPLKNESDAIRAREQGVQRLCKYADKRFRRALLEEKRNIPEGAFVDGLGPTDLRFPCNGFYRTLHGIYTTMDEIPVIKAGKTLRGFFPISLWQEERALVEFGFPGPRLKRYNNREWRSLLSCVKTESASEITLCPKKKDQIKLAQELVDLGYIVPDFY